MARDAGPFAVLSVFLVGVVAGGVTALLLGTDDKGNTKGALKARIKYTKDHIGEGGLWLRNQAGEIADYVGDQYGKAEKMLEKKLVVLKERYDQIDRAKYSQAVNEVVEKMKTTGEVTVTQAKTISQFLMDDYHTLAEAPVKKAPVKTAGKKATK
jgi:hypothetical protein